MIDSMPLRLSALDQSVACAGRGEDHALRDTVALAEHCEALGYERFWVSEHHGMPTIVGTAPEVLMAAIAARTTRIRIGSAGVMLPHYSAFKVAEAFRVLDALAPGRIDLGLGRAPGSDRRTAMALNPHGSGMAEDFPRQVLDLQAWVSGRPHQGVVAHPLPPSPIDADTDRRPEMWILGSSDYGAQLAAALGLPYAFASHFAPAAMMHAIAIYRERFEPSEQLGHPHVMLGVNVVAAESDEKAAFLRTSVLQSFVNLRSGRPGKLPPPVEGYEESLGRAERHMLDETLSCSVHGAPGTVKAGLEAFIARTGADELMVTTHIHDHEARLRSFEIVAEQIIITAGRDTAASA